MKAGQRGASVFNQPVPDGPGILTVRFTDDAGLNWQVDDDLHLEQRANRDDW